MFTKQKSTKTSMAKKVTLFALALVFAGVVGCITWQTLKMNDDDVKDIDSNIEEDTKTDTVNTPTATDSTDESSNVTAKSYDMIITEWGVGADYDGSIEITYTYDKNSDTVKLLGSKLEGVDFCKPGYSGSIERLSPNDEMMDPTGVSIGMTVEEFIGQISPESSYIWKKVGDYYYVYSGPQAICSNDMVDYEYQAAAATKLIVPNLEPVL